MKLPSKKSALWPAVICALAAVLVTLGALQYRWSKEISEATTSRMRADLIRSMVDFRRDFLHELSSVARTLEPDYTDRPDLDSYAQEWAKWRRTAPHPGMVQDVYIWQTGLRHSQLLKIKSPGEAPQRVKWPSELEPLRATLIPILPGPRFLVRAPGLPPRESKHIAGEGSELGVTLGIPAGEFATLGGAPSTVADGSISVAGVKGPLVGVSGSLEVQNDPGANDGRNFVVHLKEKGLLAVNRAPWMVIPSIPALVHPLALAPSGPRPSRAGCRESCSGWMVITLNQAFFSQHFFPELAARHFSGADYEVAVVSDEKEDRAIYFSNAEALKKTIANADASLSLFTPPGPLHPYDARFAALPRLKGVTSTMKYGDIQRIFEGEEAMELQSVPGVSALDGWQLVVNNRRGSLEAAVAALRRRHLFISFGVLLVLAATMAIIIVATRRVQELARLQMDFVAGVSHELRTPLTVISSAADNLADGVVKSKEQVAHYGTALKDQAGQLKELVEQILLFAATRDRRQTYSLRAAQVGDALDLALQNTAGLIRSAGFAVEFHVSPELPEVLIDVQALARCLQNLITNAIKYGGEACWIGIKAKTAEHGQEVTVSVRDRGIGINQDELKHIFEPFYRSASVRDAQIHGSGLGLPVANSIAQSMGGKITVESVLGQGSSFTVHLPAAHAVVAQRALQTTAAATLNIY